MLESSSDTQPRESDDEQRKKLTILLTVNRAYQQTVDEKLAKLRDLLCENLQKQNELVEQMSAQTAVGTSDGPKKNSLTLFRHEKELAKIKENYFKDLYQSEPENNLDTIRKSKFIFCDFTPMLKSEWTIQQRTKLRQAVLGDAVRIIKQPFKNKATLIEEKLFMLRRKSGEAKDINELARTLKETNNQLTKIDELTEEQVLNSVPEDKIDWMKISKVDLNDQWSSMECRLVWINVCHPKINQSKWTAQENQRLIELARIYRERNWAQIAVELDTNRSAFLCMKRYHEKTADRFCKRDWDEDEAREIVQLAERHRIGYYVPYNYLCYLNGTRDRTSIMSVHQKADRTLNHGKWTASEEQALDEALGYYKVRNWQEIAEYVGTRTALQCRDRYELKYLYPDKYVNWTRDEDKILLDAVDEWGPLWARIASAYFPTRSDHSCLFRHTKLMVWRKKNEWLEAQPDDIKEFIMFVFRPRNGANRPAVEDDDNQVVYTRRGEIVPTEPKFGTGIHNLQNIIEKVYEKRDLVAEFVEKKRTGQLSLSLLTRIGIYTPVLNGLISKYKKISLKKGPVVKKPVVPRAPRKKKLKSTPNTEQPTAEAASSSVEPSTTPAPKKIRAKSIRIRDAIQTSEATTRGRKPKSKKINMMDEGTPGVSSQLPKKRAKKATEQQQLTLNEHLKIRNDSKLRNFLKKNEKFIDPVLDKDRDNQLISLHLNKPARVTIRKINQDREQNKSSRITVRDLLLKRDQDRHPDEGQVSQANPVREISVNKENRVKRTYRKRKNKEPVDTSGGPVCKKRKEAQDNQAKKINSARNDDERLSQIKKTIEGLRVQNVVENTQAVIKFEEIKDGTKLPVFAEQQNEFRYLYSLKKEANNQEFFKKLKIMECKGVLVGIKPLNWTAVGDYWNESRVQAIERALNKIK